MGWSEDLLLAGLITQDEFENMSEIGSDIRHYGDVESIEDLMFIAYENDLDDLGDRLSDEWNSAIDYYEKESSYTISYDPSIDRWRSVETGRFVPDPYELIRD